ncbi:MAG: ATP-dependent DNA helicase RecQ [Candidatus Omnitrophota bacterium]|nr:ATP-dependent DNA helicase RecQ [Candidatus Omnitrophota bacterium]
MELTKKYISGEMLDCLKRYWGYARFRPWQEDTILAILDERDSLTVLPTGGGKSLCFQLPALLKEGMAVVISPLISLMKDQVDGLKEMGIEAECLNSSQPVEEQRAVAARIRQSRIKLLYISPERLRAEPTVSLLKSVPLSFFVIDEAHCISHWGHDFREDYRGLNFIKENFASANIHAFTATATKEVCLDILGQLNLGHPFINIASVDRPNLVYRVMPRLNIISQITELLERHRLEAGIIYCLRRDDVDDISARLNELGFKNLPYHAGLSDGERHANQESFIREEVDIIVATVAFGMGIDRPDIRFVIHAAMPKSIEHYHQETGRAGRDSLSAYCYMFYGGGDFRVWSFFLKQSPNKEVMMDKLQAIYNFCARPQCRHKIIVDYFNQDYRGQNCQACDYCLQEVEMVDEPLKIGQGILRCVQSISFEHGQGFGAGYIANLLKGNLTEQISRWRHQQAACFGSMPEEPLVFIRFMIEQLVGQGFLRRDGEYATLSLTDFGRRLLGGEVTPILAKPLIAKKRKEISAKQREKKAKDWAQVDGTLFELLRRKRAQLAQKQGVPAYIIFGDRSLKDMSMIKPLTSEAFATVFGVGEHKLKLYAEQFIAIIKEYTERKKE